MGHKPDKNGVIRYSQWVPGASDSGPNDEPRSYWEKMLREERQKQVQRPKQPSELQNAMNRPITQVWTAYNLANESMDATKARFPHKTMWNDEADAYRHFRWNYAMAQAIGKEAADGFATSHETDDQQPVAERDMDLRNNRLGRAMAVDPRFKHLSPDEAAELALRRGWLRQIK